MFQDFRLLEDRTAEENVAFALEVTGARRSTIPARVMRVLTQVGLAAKASAYPRELSGGEQQRVAIARALVNEPQVLLADEPTGNLDERATRGVFQLLRDINASGTAVVMATHDLELVRSAPYRVIELQDGAVVYDSAVDESAAGETPGMTLTVREALLAFRRAPLLSALSVTTIAFSLFVLGLFGLVAVNLRQALRGVAERVEIVAYVLPGTPIETVTLAAQDIEAFPEVLSADYVTEDSALARARRELVEFRDLLRELERNPLPASIEVKLKPGYQDATARERRRRPAPRLHLRGRCALRPRLGGEARPAARLAAAVGLVVGAAFAIVAVIIIGTTIRMAVLQRSREIAIMRLVGATDGFIRRPFLLEGALKGLLGGLVAVGSVVRRIRADQPVPHRVVLLHRAAGAGGGGVRDGDRARGESAQRRAAPETSMRHLETTSR